MPEHEIEPGSMGLPGYWRLAFNATAMSVITGAFLWCLYRMDRNAHEDRTLCREQIQEIRKLAENIKEELQTIHKQLHAGPEKP